MFQPFEIMMAMRYLRSSRREGFISVISTFSLLGIMLGVATLIIVMAVMNGFRIELMNRILGINAHISLTRYGESIGSYEELVNTVKKVPGVTQVAPVIDGQVMASANEYNTGAMVKGMQLADLKDKALVAKKIIKGNLDDLYGTDTVIIGQRMAESMRLGVGDTITLISPQTTETVVGAIPRIKDYRVVAIFEVGMFEYDSGYVFMPLEAAQLYFKMPGGANLLEVMVGDTGATESIMRDILRATNSALVAVDWQRMNAHFLNSLKVERNVMFLILTLIIVVAAFNIISSMIMLVNDKARAIAILRTMGASSGSIMRIFFLCGSAIGVAGTLMGFLLGVGFAANIENIRRWLEKMTGTELFSAEIYFLSQLRADVQVGDVVGVVGMALALSFLATLYPAWKASRISPAEGVRYE